MSTFIEFLDPIAGITVQAMLNSIWKGVIITVLVFGLVKLLRRTNAATRYAMWMVTLTAVFCLFMLNAWSAGGGYDLLNLVKFNEETQEPFGEMNPDLQQPAPVLSTSEKPEETAVPEAENAESLLMTGSEITSESTAPSNYQIHLAPGMWHIFVFCAWFLIALFLLLRLIHSYFYSLHLKRSARQLPGKHQKMLGSWVYTQKIKRNIRLCISQQVTTPLAIGLFNPIILIPESLLNKLNEAELKQVIAHELAHLRRRDDWTNLLQKVIEALLFFHPAVWFLKNRLNLEREIACDDSVIAISGKQRQYAECMVRLAELMPFLSLSRPVLASGVIQTKNHILIRMEEIMKTNRTFKTGISVLSVSSVLLLLSFGLFQFTIMPPLVALEEEQQIQTDVLKLELAFGDEKTITKDEFLLVEPEIIKVNYSGDIFVLDEHRIKVYDDKGRAKHFIGRPGQGPGEYENISGGFKMSPAGYITFMDRSSYNIFSSDGTFITKRQIRYNEIFQRIAEEHNFDISSRLGPVNSIEMVALSDSDKELIITCNTLPDRPSFSPDKTYFDYLFYAHSDTVKVLAEYEIVNTFIRTPGRGIGWSRHKKLGSFYYALLPERKILYTHTAHDAVIENGTARIAFHIVSLDDYQKRDVFYTYTPTKITKSFLDLFEGVNKGRENFADKRPVEAKYLTLSFNRIDVDGNYIFLYPILITEDEEHSVDVIDIDSGIHISTAILPFSLREIKNGYGYRVTINEEGFEIIEKYKIHPAVYGK